MKPERLNLSIKAFELQAVSRARWDEFIVELENYSRLVSEECISSPVEGLQVAQGRAREARDLLKLLKDARATAEKVKDKSR